MPKSKLAPIGGGPKNNRGTGAKYTNINLLAKVALAIKNGSSKTDAFKRYGIPVDTGFEWLAKGKQDPPHHEILGKFYRVVERAWAHYNSQMVHQVTNAATSGQPNTWQAAMTMLERRDPANWGRRDTSRVKIEAETPLVQLNQVVLADENARESLRAVLRGVAGPRPHLAIGPGVGDESEEESIPGGDAE